MKRTVIIFSAIFIAFTGCATTTPQKIFYPLETNNEDGKTITPFFSNGRAIAKLETDSVVLLTDIEALGKYGHLAGNGEYNLQIFLVMQSKYDRPFLFAPLDQIRLIIKNTKNDEIVNISPLSPTLILANLENEKNALMAFQLIGGTLKTLSASPTTVNYSNGAQAVVNDLPDKQEAIMDKTAQGMANTASLYDIYKSSIFEGILRKNTVFPNQGISGYVYIKIPEETYKSLNGGRISFDFTLWITLPDGPIHIDFTLAPGE